jgi:hypothetical protein
MGTMQQRSIFTAKLQVSDRSTPPGVRAVGARGFWPRHQTGECSGETATQPSLKARCEQMGFDWIRVSESNFGQANETVEKVTVGWCSSTPKICHCNLTLVDVFSGLFGFLSVAYWLIV